MKKYRLNENDLLPSRKVNDDRKWITYTLSNSVLKKLF